MKVRKHMIELAATRKIPHGKVAALSSWNLWDIPIPIHYTKRTMCHGDWSRMASRTRRVKNDNGVLLCFGPWKMLICERHRIRSQHILKRDTLHLFQPTDVRIHEVNNGSDLLSVYHNSALRLFQQRRIRCRCVPRRQEQNLLTLICMLKH